MKDREDFQADYYPGAGMQPTEQPTEQPVEQPPKKKKPVYKKWWFWAIAVFMFLWVVGVASEEEQSGQVNDTTAEETHDSATNPSKKGEKNNPYILNANTWHSEHCAGTSAVKYIDRWVKVSGTVLSVSEYGSLKGYYLSGGPGAGLVCWVDGGSISAQYGQQIEYIGKVTVEDSKHIEISDGQITSVSWPQKKPKSPITITEWQWTRDYVGGVEWNFKLTNNTDKTVKYVTLEWYCYNEVGDLVYDEISLKPYFSIKYTGPLAAGQTTDLLRNTTLYYSHTYYSSKLTKFTVEFTDGTVIYIHDQGYTDIYKED